MMESKYSDLVMTWLGELDYSHCFFVAGGNSMHLLDAARRTMRCVPFVHEVAAGVAAEYFNEITTDNRAFVLVTAGPGVTNLVTALAGAYLESRDLLVLGGQVKSSDLASDGIRQRGIQEVDGVAIARPVCKVAARIEHPIDRATFASHVLTGVSGRKGPVFLELCLDAQGAPVASEAVTTPLPQASAEPFGAESPETAMGRIEPLLTAARRPIVLIGGGVRRSTTRGLSAGLADAGIPLMTTWNGADRIASDHPLYFGRPNTWGQRSSNVLLQQADLVLALGSRLGLQQTGFNWQEFVPVGKVIQVDLDPAELRKGHPRVDLALATDANAILTLVAARSWPVPPEWVEFCREVRRALPLSEAWANTTAPGFLDPYEVILELARCCAEGDVIVPCSSGGAFTVPMQAFEQKADQDIVTNHGLASMGYGLAGALGAALNAPTRRVVLLEGDGGFSQNVQELATARVNDVTIKIFVFANDGYASIRMTQRNYFGGDYLGCDTKTGLGFPDWDDLAAAYGIPCHTLTERFSEDPEFCRRFDRSGPDLFIVPLDPEQTYFPKISSRVTEAGGMESAPLHMMSPELPHDASSSLLRYLTEEATHLEDSQP